MATRTPLLKGSSYIGEASFKVCCTQWHFNQTQSSAEVHLFETAVVYLPWRATQRHSDRASDDGLVVSSYDARVVRGVVEVVLQKGCRRVPLEHSRVHLWISGGWFGDSMVGWRAPGRLDRQTPSLHQDSWKLDGDLNIAEINSIDCSSVFAMYSP